MNLFTRRETKIKNSERKFKNNEALSYQNNLFGCKYTYVILCLYNSLCLLSLCKNSFYKKDATIPIVCLGVFFNITVGWHDLPINYNFVMLSILYTLPFSKSKNYKAIDHTD